MKSLRTQRVCFALTFALVLAAIAIAPVACKDNGASSSANGTCQGVVTDAGTCEGKCTVDKCIPQNTCVDNDCKLLCDSHLDCLPDQHCTPAQADYLLDDAGALAQGGSGSKDVQVCEPSGKATGFGTLCALGTECDNLYACPDGSPCDPTGGDAGGTCAAADCKALTCRSTGAGDAQAYCTRWDCHADTDCPDGYECGIARDPHLICGKTPAKPMQGGITPCVDPSTYQANGQTYQEGPISLLRNQCIKRGQCMACQTDLDCSEFAEADPSGNLAPTQRCVTIGGEQRCARNCKSAKDCSADYTCTDGSCTPRFGSCTGTGQFCEPCQNDLDCGGTATNSKACASLFGDQRACIDESLPDTCMTSADCPLTPDKKHNGVCFDSTPEGDNILSTDPTYHHCYFPFDSTTAKFSCW